VSGGWYSTWQRRFPSSGITAVLEFSGAPLLTEDVDVTLSNLAFAGQDSWLRLGDVPPILLAECRADVLEIAGRFGTLSAP